MIIMLNVLYDWLITYRPDIFLQPTCFTAKNDFVKIFLQIVLTQQ